MTFCLFTKSRLSSLFLCWYPSDVLIVAPSNLSLRVLVLPRSLGRPFTLSYSFRRFHSKRLLFTVAKKDCSYLVFPTVSPQVFLRGVRSPFLSTPVLVGGTFLGEWVSPTPVTKLLSPRVCTFRVVGRCEDFREVLLYRLLVLIQISPPTIYLTCVWRTTSR